MNKVLLGILDYNDGSSGREETVTEFSVYVSFKVNTTTEKQRFQVAIHF